MVLREEFLCKYMEKLNHKIIVELKENLPTEGIVMDMITQANAIVHRLTKEV